MKGDVNMVGLNVVTQLIVMCAVWFTGFLLIGYAVSYVWVLLLLYRHEMRHYKKAKEISEQNCLKIPTSKDTLKVSEPPSPIISFTWFRKNTYKKVTKKATYIFSRNLNSSAHVELSNHFLVYTNEELKDIAKAGDDKFLLRFRVTKFFVYSLVVWVSIVLCVFMIRTGHWISLPLLFAPVGGVVYYLRESCRIHRLKKAKALSNWSDEKVQENPSGFYEHLIEKAKNEGVDEELIALYEKRRNEVIQYYKEHQN